MTEVRATIEGRVRVTIANALDAIAAVLAQEVPLETNWAALRTIANSVSQTTGCFNFLGIGCRRVLVDSCHNLHGMAAMADLLKRTNEAHTIVVIAMAAVATDEEGAETE